MMEKDGRYKKIKPLFKNKVILSFSQIFSMEVIPKTLLAKDLQKNNDQITKLIESPGGFKIKDVIRISELFELTIPQVTELFEPDHHDDYEINQGQKDNGYKHIRTLFDEGEIRTFDDIFDHVAKTTVARDIGKGRGRFDLAKFTVTHIARIAKLCELTLAEVFQLINTQLKKQRKSIP